MATVSLFWDINMAAVTSCENTLYCFKPLTIKKEKNFLFFENFLCTLTMENTELFIYLLFIFLMLAESRKPNAKKKENRKRWNRKTAYVRCKNGHKTEIWRFAVPTFWLANTSFEFLLEHLLLNFYFGPNWKGSNVHLYFFYSCTKYRSILRFNKSNIDNSHTNRVGLPVLKSKNVSV